MSWLDTNKSGGIGRADIDRALASGRTERDIQAELARAQSSGVEVGEQALSWSGGATPVNDFYFTNPEYAAGMQGAELQTRSQISNYGWDTQKAMENIRQAAETERIKYEVDNRIPLVQAEAQGKLDLQKIVNAGYKNIANIERGTEMVRNVTSMFNF